MPDVGIEQAGGFAGVLALLGVIVRWVQQAGHRGDQQSAAAWDRMVQLLDEAKKNLERVSAEYSDRIQKLEAAVVAANLRADETAKKLEESERARQGQREELSSLARSRADVANELATAKRELLEVRRELEDAKNRLIDQMIRALHKEGPPE